MKKHGQKTLIILISILSLCFFCCGDKNSKNPSSQIQTRQVKSFCWYYLTPSGISQASNFQDIPPSLKKPYTESIRISSFAQAVKPQGEQTFPACYALVNRLGLIEFVNNDFIFYKEQSLFDNRTTDQIVFMYDVPLFCFYRNTFFNGDFDSNNKADYKNEPFLVQFDPVSKVFFPVITTGAMNLNSLDQINDYTWDGIWWFCSVKNSTQDKTSFKYLKWESASNLLGILPDQTRINTQSKIDANSKINLVDSNVEEFRGKKSVIDFDKAPQRLKKLLNCLPDSFEFEVEAKTAGGPSARYFSKNPKADNLMQAKAQINDIWTACVFPDGTMYFHGALNELSPVTAATALRLPKLPEGSVYTDFGITGDYLYVSWQENEFYKTARSGFLAVNMSEILYGRL